MKPDLRWGSLWERLDDNIASSDLDGTLLDTNRGVGGSNPGDLAGKSLYDYLVPDDQERLRQAIESARQTGVISRFEVAADSPAESAGSSPGSPPRGPPSGPIVSCR